MDKRVRLRLVELCLRTAIWAFTVFAIIPSVFLMMAKFRPALVMNDNVAGLFVVALLAVFAVWRRNALLAKPLGWNIKDFLIFGPVAAIAFIGSFVLTYTLDPYASLLTKALYVTLSPLLFATGALALAVAIFGVPLFRRERRSLMVGLLVGIPYVALSLLLRQLWPYMSSFVLNANGWLLSLTGDPTAVTYGAAPTIALKSFIVIIGEACSGVDSAIMFTGVFVFLALLDWKRFDRRKLLILFPIGLLGMYAVNIARVALIMLVGAYWSPDLALSLFHENAGWILFVAYTLGFWYIAYPRILRRRR